MSDKRPVAEYANLRSFCSNLSISHFLNNPYNPVVEILQVFGHRIKNGCYSKKSSVQADMVSLVWRAIATTHLLEGRQDPCKPLVMVTMELDLRLSRQLCYYSFLETPDLREKAVPLGLVVVSAKGSTRTTKGLFLRDLIYIALYLCFRSCEYTKKIS